MINGPDAHPGANFIQQSNQALKKLVILMFRRERKGGERGGGGGGGGGLAPVAVEDRIRVVMLPMVTLFLLE